MKANLIDLSDLVWVWGLGLGLVNISGLESALEIFKDSFEHLKFSAFFWDQEMPH